MSNLADILGLRASSGRLKDLSLAELGEMNLDQIASLGLTPPQTKRAQLLAGEVRRLQNPSVHGQSFDGPAAAAAAFGRLKAIKHEELWVLALDSRMRAMFKGMVARGGRNTVSILPSDVLAPAVRAGATAVLLVHNHPSGDPTPSAEDIALTDRIEAAADLLGIALVDHIVVAADGWASMAELGHVGRSEYPRLARAAGR